MNNHINYIEFKAKDLEKIKTSLLFPAGIDFTLLTRPGMNLQFGRIDKKSGTSN